MYNGKSLQLLEGKLVAVVTKARKGKNYHSYVVRLPSGEIVTTEADDKSGSRKEVMNGPFYIFKATSVREPLFHTPIVSVKYYHPTATWGKKYDAIVRNKEVGPNPGGVGAGYFLKLFPNNIKKVFSVSKSYAFPSKTLFVPKTVYEGVTDGECIQVELVSFSSQHFVFHGFRFPGGVLVPWYLAPIQKAA